MLKLREPIKTKNRTDFVSDNSLFESRLLGNYNLMGNDLSSDELLHLVSTPPQIYIAEGGATTTVGQSFVSTHNEQNLDIINNVLNRIMVSAKGELTYQDRAYITDVLYKLGIRDDKKFMSQVLSYMDQSRTEQRFLELYLSEGIDGAKTGLLEEFRTLRQELSQQRDEREPFRNDLYLSTQILNRLQTAQIYQTVSSFNKSSTENLLESSEYAVSEQTMTSETLLRDFVIRQLSAFDRELVYRTEEGAQEAEASQEGAFVRERILERERSREILRERTQEGGTDRQTVRTQAFLNVPGRVPETELVFRNEGGPGEELSEEETVPAHDRPVPERTEREILRERVTEPGTDRETVRIETVTETPQRGPEEENVYLIRERAAGEEASQEEKTQIPAPGAEAGREYYIDTVREITEEPAHSPERIPADQVSEFRQTEMILTSPSGREEEGEPSAQAPEIIPGRERIASSEEPAETGRQAQTFAQNETQPAQGPREILTREQTERLITERESEQSERLRESITAQEMQYRETELVLRTQEALSREETPAPDEAAVQSPGRRTMAEFLKELQREQERSETLLRTERSEQESREFTQTEIIHPAAEEGPEEGEAEAPQIQAPEAEKRPAVTQTPAPSEAAVAEEVSRITDRTETVIRNEVTQRLRTERETERRTIERERVLEEGTQYRETELVHRIETPAEGSGGSFREGEVPPSIRSYQYISNNIYERELGRGEIPEGGSVTEEINAAVLLDMVKNLYHSEYRNISRRNTNAVSFSPVFYRASENILNRLNRITEQDLAFNEIITENYPSEAPGAVMSYPAEAEEVISQVQAQPPSEEGPTLEQRLIALNEQNLRNEEKYVQMMQLIQSLNEPVRSEGGAERTRRDALAALSGNEELIRILAPNDDEGQERRERIITEIEQLMPQNMVQVFRTVRRMTEQREEGSGDAAVIQSNLEQAAEEIKRFAQVRESAPPPKEERTEISGSELIHRVNETLTADEISELLETVNRSRSTELNRADINSVTDINSYDTRTTRMETNNVMTMEQRDDIAEMIARGVRAQVGAISEEVLSKLEKRLRNEKSRRGI